MIRAVWYVHCEGDTCIATSEPEVTRKLVWKLAKQRGWKRTKNGHLCPSCANESKEKRSNKS